MFFFFLRKGLTFFWYISKFVVFFISVDWLRGPIGSTVHLRKLQGYLQHSLHQLSHVTFARCGGTVATQQHAHVGAQRARREGAMRMLTYSLCSKRMMPELRAQRGRRWSEMGMTPERGRRPRCLRATTVPERGSEEGSLRWGRGSHRAGEPAWCNRRSSMTGVAQHDAGGDSKVHQWLDPRWHGVAYWKLPLDAAAEEWGRVRNRHWFAHSHGVRAGDSLKALHERCE
jgi:hypothetical protein